MTMRSVACAGTLALIAPIFGAPGCGGNNSPATTGGSGGVTSTGGTTEVTATGGAIGSGGTTEPATGQGGSGGTTAAATSFAPLCSGLLTAANVAPTKNGICVESDPQLCYKTCGPQSIGFKSEICTAGVYVEQSGCSFLPDMDYSCYKIPAAIDPSCPTDAPPQATTVCNVAPCTLCNLNGDYLDSGGNAKTGYCVCPTPSTTTGTAKWSCASTTAWPCPAGKGC